ncbi:MAG TPA: hypothetical protein PKL77_06310 [Candidatus Omnitrophota bacterium]|nr:hypothetical protein [Candidatus Omnitrophota bacterium]HPT07907.1 hypothetical protein [Candidatus Omnitrophota bacterium]
MYKSILMMFAGVILVLGFLLLLGKSALKKIEDIMNKPLVKAQDISETKTKFLGLALIVFSCILFYMSKRLGF